MKLLILTFCATMWWLIKADGTVQIRFIEYVNPDGKEANGMCCDKIFGHCFSECDHMFTICLDEVNSSRTDTSVCKYGRVQTGAVKNKNNIRFTNMIRDTPNPVVFTIQGAMPKEMVLKVNVVDKDKYGHHDNVEVLYNHLSLSADQITDAKEVRYNIKSRTRLVVMVTARCNRDWFTPECDVHCRYSGWDQHYTCDKHTGSKVCKTGWMGEGCDIPAEVCLHDTCNFGTCSIVNGKASCECPPNFSGPFCQRHICQEICGAGLCSYSSATQFWCHCPQEHSILYKPGDEAICSLTTTSTTTPQPSTTVSTTSTSTTTSTPSTTTRTTTRQPGSSPTTTSITRKENADCAALAESGSIDLQGMYMIHPHGAEQPIPVYCYLTYDGSAWTVIQRRKDGSVDFNRIWSDYVDGFGSPVNGGEYWVGLEYLHLLTNQARYKIEIQMQLGDGSWYFATYNHFSVSGADANYTLYVSGYEGNAGDALHSGTQFSTKDRDHDGLIRTNCAKMLMSGWWFTNCGQSNLNGLYVRHRGTGSGHAPCGPAGKCVRWATIPQYGFFSLQRTTMKIKPN